MAGTTPLDVPGSFVAHAASYDGLVDPLANATDALIRAGRRLGARGLISAGEGNLSVRLDADRLLVTPAGLRKDELEADDLVVVWLDHPERDMVSRSGRAPTSDLAIHVAIHAARPDLGAVAHAHLPASMGLTLAGEIPDPAALPETALLLPRLPFLTLGVPGSDELASRVAAALSEPPEPLASAVLLERHGAVAVGGDPAHAVDRLELVEVLCRTWRDALLIRAARSSLGIVEAPSPGSQSEGR
jgi:L-fuculose-phosphate aldolase